MPLSSNNTLSPLKNTSRLAPACQLAVVARSQNVGLAASPPTQVRSAPPGMVRVIAVPVSAKTGTPR